MQREGVLLLMFDIPQNDREERRNYGKFVRHIKKNGFLMLQESVYVKHISNLNNVENEEERIREIAPSDGNIIALKLTIAQFQSVDIVRGNAEKYKRIYSPALYF